MKLKPCNVSMWAAVISAALMMASCACSRPASEEMYLNENQVDAYGRYVFGLDLSDSLATYDLSIGASLALTDQEYASFVGVPLHILWQSPSNQYYEDEVCLNREYSMGGDFFSKHFGGLYRENMVPRERGIWKLYVSVPPGLEEEFEFHGIGLILTRK